jgi:hypothetical protein
VAANPSAITNVVATVNNSAATPNVTITWNAPSSTGGTPVTYSVKDYEGNSVTCTSLTGTTCVVDITSSSLQYYLDTNGDFNGYGDVFDGSFTVTATNGSGLTSSGTSNNVLVASPEAGAPAVTVSSTEVTWTDPSDIQLYGDTAAFILQYETCTSSTASSCSPSGSPVTVSGNTLSWVYASNGFTPPVGAYFGFSVKADDQVGPSAAGVGVISSVLTGSGPSAPTISAETASNSTISVAWTPNASNGGSVLTGYSVQLLCSSSTTVTANCAGYNAVTVPATTTSYTFSSLAPDYYVVKVTPINAVGNGTSVSSTYEEVGINPLGAPAGSSAYSSPAFSYTPTTLTVSWTAVAAGYSVNTITVIDGTKSTTVCTVPASALSCTVPIANVAANDGLYFVSTDAAGVISENGGAATVTVPPVGTSLSLYSNANGIYMTWGAVSNALAYNLLGVGSDGSRITKSFPAGTTSATFNYGTGGLTVGVTYAWQIDTANAFGASVYSSANSSYSTATVPTTPTPLSCVTTSTTLTCSWTLSSASPAVTSYLATLTWPNGQTTVVTAAAGTSTTTFTGLTPLTSYSLTVVAVAPLGNSATSTALTATTIGTPSAPTGLTAVTDPGSSGYEADLSWTAPTNLGGTSASLSYSVYEYVVGGSLVPTLVGSSIASTATTFTVSSLSSSESYVFAVAEVNAVGLGTPATVLYTSPTTPSAPTGVTAVEQADGGYTLTWTAPANTDGAIISEYDVYYTVTSPSGSVIHSNVYAGVSTYDSSPATPAPTTVVDHNFNLVSGDTVSFSVVAYDTWNNVSLLSSSSATSTYLTTPNAPSSPYQTSQGTPFSATTSPSGIGVSWYNLSNSGASGYDPTITSYTVELVGGPSIISKTIPASDTTDTFDTYVFPASVLTNGVTYAAELFSTNALKSSATTTSTFSLPTPGSPIHLTVAVEDALQTAVPSDIVVSWTASSSYAPVTYSVVGFQNGLPAYTTTTSATQVTLPYASTFTSFSVTATSIGGSSTATTLSSGSFLADPGLPAVPSLANLRNYPNEIKLYWYTVAPPADPVTGYAVTFTPAAGGAAIACSYFNVASPVTNNSECDVVGLTPNTAYNYSIVALSALGSSPALTGIVVSSPDNAAAPTVTSVVPTLSVTGDLQVAVSWTAPTYTGGVPITGYYVGVFVGGSYYFCYTAPTSTATSCTVDTGTGNTGSVSAYVVAVTEVGSGDSSSLFTPTAQPYTTAAGAPTTPLSVTANYGTLSSSAVGSLTVTWVEPPSTQLPVTGFTIVPYDVVTGLTLTPVTVGASATSATITGLPTGTEIDLQVYADNMYLGVVTPSASYGAADWLGWTAPEAAPNITSVALPSAGTEVVSWAAPVPFKAGDAGSSVTGYVVSATNTTTGAVVSQTLAANVLTYTFTGLPTGSTYTVSVAATNSLGTGPSSQVTGSKASLAVPGAPKITSVTPTSSSLAISWSAPTTTGGSAITGYLVSVTSGNVTVTCGTVAATATTCTIPGLSAGTAYSVSVSAENANGPGVAATSTGTTSAQVVLPTKPANVTVAFAAGSTALTAAAKNALTALGLKLAAGAQLTLTGYAKGDTFLAKSRATTVALFLEAAVSNIKFVLHEVTTSSANAVTVVTVIA